jgi:hypothetical protein
MQGRKTYAKGLDNSGNIEGSLKHCIVCAKSQKVMTA